MQKEFIKLEINIPYNDIKDFIIDIASDLNNLSRNSNIEYSPTNINKKFDIELLTISEVSKRLKVNVNYVYYLIKKGHIEALKLGSLKITSTELERFINSSIGKDFTDLNNVKDMYFHNE